MPTPPITTRSAGMFAYIKHGFLYRWNLLLFLGGAGLAAMSPWPDALLPILTGLEVAYLTALIALPRFRTGVDAIEAGSEVRAGLTAPEAAAPALGKMISSLPSAALRRFVMLRQRCFDMRAIASGVRGQTANSPDSASAIGTPALDRLLFLFLKLLLTQDALDRFLHSTSDAELSERLADMEARLVTARTAKDERLTRSLSDSVADAQLRLDNYRKSVKDAEFVEVELDRIETKIHALTEMGVSRQDPDALSHQVTAAAESMQQTELAVDQLRHLTGLADTLQDPPSILEADLGALVTTRGR